jgi:hypothetical protein
MSSLVIADEEALREALHDYADIVATLVQEAAGQIASRTEDLAVRRATVQWKLRAVSAIRGIVLRRDPRSALVDAWAFALLMRQYVERGTSRFGEQQALAIAASVQAETAIERIAASYLDAQALESARTFIREYVRSNPLQEGIAARPLFPSEETKNPIVSRILGAPSALNPFGGLDEGAKAIREFSEVAERFTEVVKYVPETTAWQLELLLYDLEGSETVRSLKESVREVAKAAANLADTADRLPRDVEGIVRKTFEEMEAQQGSLRETAREARETIDRAEALATALERSADAVAKAGAAWEATARAFGAGGDETPAPPPASNGGAAPKEEEGGFDPKEFGDAADRLTHTADEIRGLVKDVRDLAASKELGATLEGVNTLSRSAVDHLFWRGVQLVGVVLLAAMVYRVVPIRRRGEGSRRG